MVSPFLSRAGSLCPVYSTVQYGTVQHCSKLPRPLVPSDISFELRVGLLNAKGKKKRKRKKKKNKQTPTETEFRAVA